jgi:hypothetical protein
MIRAALVVATTLAFGLNPAQAELGCHKSGRFQLSSDGDFPMGLPIKSGTACEGTFGAIGSTNMTFNRLFLVAAPSRGKIRPREGGHYIYTAPAAPGSDSFTLKVCGTQDSKPGCATLNFSVNVN